MSRDEVRNDGTGDETSDARRARRRDEKRGKELAVKTANFTRPFLDSENGTKMGVTHLCLPCTIPKHFAVLSPIIMLRSLPEVVRSSKHYNTFDHKTWL